MPQNFSSIITTTAIRQINIVYINFLILNNLAAGLGPATLLQNRCQESLLLWRIAFLYFLVSSLAESQSSWFLRALPPDADDLVLLAPSWWALQSLLRAVKVASINISMTFNTRKTVCMVFNPSDRCKIAAETFPAFVLCDSPLLTVNKFKYFGPYN